MRLLSTVMPLLFFMACTAMQSGAPQPEPAEERDVEDTVEAFTLHGNLLASDGSPLPGGQIIVTDDRKTYTTKIQPDGTYELAIDSTGIYRAYFTGAGHYTHYTQLLINSKDELQKDLRLKPVRIKSEPEAVFVVTGDLTGRAQAYRMQLVEDQVYKARIPVDSDTLAYRISGVTTTGYTIVNPDADRIIMDHSKSLRPHRPHPYYAIKDGIRDSVATITFNLAEFYPYTLDSEISYDNPDHQTAVFSRVQRVITEPLKSMRNVALQNHRNLGEPLRTFEYDYTPAQQILDEAIEEASGFKKQLLIAEYFKFRGMEPNPDYFSYLIDNVDPKSVIWEVYLDMTAQLQRIGEEVGMREEALEMQERILEAPHSDNLKANILYFRIFEHHQKGDEDKVILLLSELRSKFPGHPITRTAQVHYRPERKIQEGHRVPEFEVPSLDEADKIISNKSLKGKTYLLDFWAVWCAPCITEMPYLHEANEKFSDEDFTIVSLSFDYSPEDVIRFRDEEWEMPWLHAFIEDGFENEITRDFDLVGIPRPILVDESGTIIAMDNRLRGDNLIRTLERYFEGMLPPPLEPVADDPPDEGN